MSTATHFDRSEGPVNSGSGNQYIGYYTLIHDVVPEAAKQRDPRRVASDAIAHLKQRLVFPDGTMEARRLLQTSNIALLSANPGNGARSTAKVLLWEFPHGEERFRELVDQSEEEDGGKALDPEQVEAEASLLLDLSEVREERYRVFMDDLPSFRATVRERGARLAVVLADSRKALLHEELPDLVVRLGRPCEREVLRRHLLGYGIGPDQQDLAGEQLSEFLAHASMADIAALSTRIRDARETSQAGAPFSVCLAAGLAAGEPSDEQVADMLGELPSGPQRALLLTAAFMEDARPDTVHEAADQLLRAAAHPEEDNPTLQHRPLAERLDEIRASAEGRQVRFNEPRFAKAVRSYFWDNFPHLRPRLLSWIAGAADFTAIRREDMMNLVMHHAEQCLRTGPPDDLIRLAYDWTQSSASRQELSMAARALGIGVRDPRYGSHFRRRIYDWSRDGSLPAGRAGVLVGVCSEALAVDFPEQALVRLHHLSHRRDPRLRETAREALLRITSSDDHLYHRLLERLTPDREKTGQYDIDSFLHTARPARLLDDEAARQLTNHWAAALGRAGRTDWEPAFRDWLTQAHKDVGGEGGRILNVLADACARDGTTLSPVYAVAYGWVSDDAPSREKTADALWNRAVAALGIAPSTHTR